jgi:hypothetical protein
MFMQWFAVLSCVPFGFLLPVIDRFEKRVCRSAVERRPYGDPNEDDSGDQDVQKQRKRYVTDLGIHRKLGADGTVVRGLHCTAPLRQAIAGGDAKHGQRDYRIQEGDDRHRGRDASFDVHAVVPRAGASASGRRPPASHRPEVSAADLGSGRLIAVATRPGVVSPDWSLESRPRAPKSNTPPYDRFVRGLVFFRGDASRLS